MTRAALDTSVRLDTSLLPKRNLAVHNDTIKDKATVRSLHQIIPNNLQKCLESVDLDFIKYDKYKAQNGKQDKTGYTC